MKTTIHALSTNALVNSPFYPEVLKEYNDRLSRDGRVNNLDFYRSFILPRIPTYKQASWYGFLKRFKTNVGIIEARIVTRGVPQFQESEKLEVELSKNFLAMSEATRQGILRSLNIGNDALKEILENPHMLSSKEKIELLYKAMKAQDSRAKTMTELRRDDREQKTFEEAFSDSLY